MKILKWVLIAFFICVLVKYGMIFITGFALGVIVTALYNNERIRAFWANAIKET